MLELDLHGVRHRDVERKIEDFVCSNQGVLKVITGNSPTMIRILKEVAKKHKLKTEPENDYNLGAWIVRDA